MARPESRYRCEACGALGLRWEGQCRSCGAWNSVVAVPAVERRGREAGAPGPDHTVQAVPLTALPERPLARWPIGISEFDRVLGGGMVAGSVVLLAGEPGIGKSTLALEAAAGVAGATVAEGGVLYVSGEESAGQLRLRAARLGVLDGPSAAAIRVVSETDLEAILAAARDAAAQLLVVDSIQMVSAAGPESAPGSLSQVREATAGFVDHAKRTGTAVLLVGHVTKEGSLAGPKVLEHLVDAVLTLEGERYGPLRILRATKNRFGATDEVGVFEMTADGLRELSDPARAFLGEGVARAPGVAAGVALEGSRPLVVEVQTLVVNAPYGSPRRTVSGVDQSRLNLLIAVLARRAGINLGGHDVYASLAGGLTVEEPALDLPLALALASSARDRATEPRTVACGEIGLLGEVRPVSGLERRLREAQRLGFARAIVPAGAAPSVPGLEIVGVVTLRDAISAALVEAPTSALVGSAS